MANPSFRPGLRRDQARALPETVIETLGFESDDAGTIDTTPPTDPPANVAPPDVSGSVATRPEPVPELAAVTPPTQEAQPTE